MNSPVDPDALTIQEAAAKAHIHKPWYRCVGPGLITGAADDDPSGIGTYSANGAQFGYTLLWLVPFCLPLMIAVQEMCGRIGAVTGKGLAAIIREYYPAWLLYLSVALLVLANVFNIYADLNVMAASANMLFGVPFGVALTVIALVIVTLQILLPYRIYAKILKWLCLSLLGYVAVALLPGVKNNWHAIGRALFLPHIDLKAEIMLAIVAFLGTTISPYLFFWQTGETLEDEVAEGHADLPGHRLDKVSDEEIRNVRLDTVIGMLASQLVAFFIIIAAAGTLHANGITQINTAQDAAKALLPLGAAAYWIFTLCMLGTGLLAIPTLAGSVGYAISEMRGWPYGLYRRFSKAKQFYMIIAVTILIGYALNFVGIISPIKALVYSAALNGVIAPPMIVILLLICNNRTIIGEHKNGFWSNVLGFLTVVVMGVAAAYLLYAMVSGKMWN